MLEKRLKLSTEDTESLKDIVLVMIKGISFHGHVLSKYDNAPIDWNGTINHVEERLHRQTASRPA